MIGSVSGSVGAQFLSRQMSRGIAFGCCYRRSLGWRKPKSKKMSIGNSAHDHLGIKILAAGAVLTGPANIRNGNQRLLAIKEDATMDLWRIWAKALGESLIRQSGGRQSGTDTDADVGINFITCFFIHGNTIRHW